MLFNKYIDQYGTITCANIQQQTFVRLFYLEDMDEFNKLEQSGGYSDFSKASAIVDRAVQWTMGILIDKGAVEVRQ